MLLIALKLEALLALGICAKISSLMPTVLS